MDEDDVRAFAEFMDRYHVDSEIGVETFECEFREFLTVNLNQRAEELDLSELVDIGGDGYEWDMDVDRSGIRSKLQELLQDTLQGFGYTTVASLSLDLDDIVSSVDIGELADQYVRSSSEPDSDGYRGGGATYSDQSIDDLFQRS